MLCGIIILLAAKMNTKRVWVIAGGGLLVAAIGMLYLFHPNDLGLTEFDLAMGGHPRMDALRTNTKAAADSFLAQRKTDLADSTGGDYELAVDYSKSSKIRSLGYRSSFYYYCWDIYLPYSLRTRSGTTATVLVHLSDGTQGYGHDPHRFRVLEVMLLDQQGRITKRVAGI
jgi:hypothetical protein